MQMGLNWVIDISGQLSGQLHEIILFWVSCGFLCSFDNQTSQES